MLDSTNTHNYPLKEWLNLQCINIGIVGVSGVGKSTMINSILELKGPNRAKIGVTETTTVINTRTFEPNSYNLKLNQCNSDTRDLLKLYDLPGCGTVNQPRDDYISDFGLIYFDIVIIVIAERIREDDEMLIQSLNAFNVKTIIVRNKIDQAIDDNMDEYDKPPDKTISEIRQY